MIFFVCAVTSAAEGSPTNKVAVQLRVVDRLTEIPISGALVSLRISDTQLEDLGRSTNGMFSFAHPITNELVQLRVQAEDYSRQGVSLALTNSQIEKEIKLDRTLPLHGVAIAPAGQFASGARVVILGNQKVGMIKPDAKIETFGQYSVELAGDDGSFSVGPESEGESILVVHELGVGQMPLIGWTNGTRIQLRAWTRATGRMRINNAPAANEGLMAASVRFPGALSPVQLQDFQTQTDAAGNFFFDRLPPGEITLLWKIPTGAQSFSYSHGHSFMLDPAFPTDIDYHLRGRAVRGQVVVADKDFDWNANHVFAGLGSQPKGATEFDPLGVPALASHFVLKMDQNGKFEAEAIPPGSYTIFVRARRQNRSIQTTYANLIVPGGVEPVDLGQVQITNRVKQFPLGGH